MMLVPMFVSEHNRGPMFLPMLGAAFCGSDLTYISFRNNNYIFMYLVLQLCLSINTY